MKILITIITATFLCHVSLSGQVITANNTEKISNINKRQLLIYFNDKYLPSSFDKNEKQIISVYKHIFNNEVKQISSKELHNLNKENIPDYYIIHVKKVTEEPTKRKRGWSRIKPCSYYNFSVKLSEKNKEVAYVNTQDCKIDELSILSSAFIIKHMIKAISEGVNYKTWPTYINTDKNKINNKTLFLNEEFINLSGLEKARVYPDEIQKKSRETIVKSIYNNENEFVYVTRSSIRNTTGEKSFTIIIDGITGTPLLRYYW